MEGILNDAFVGDFNGDGKSDLLIPQANNSDQWNLYFSDTKGFKKQIVKLFVYRSDSYSSSSSYFGRHYFVQDLNQDGKSDFVLIGTYSNSSYGGDYYPYSEFSTFLVKYYENKGINSFGQIEFEEINIDKHYKEEIDRSRPSYDIFRYYPYSSYKEGKYISSIPQDSNIFEPKSRKLPVFSPLVGNFYVNQSDHQILLISQEKIVKYSHNSISKSAHIIGITQGGLRTEVDYKELDPNKHPGFYAGVKSEQYPYMELDKVSQSYAVSQLRQQIPSSTGGVEIRKQDFRFRGFFSHL